MAIKDQKERMKLGKAYADCVSKGMKPDEIVKKLGVPLRTLQRMKAEYLAKLADGLIEPYTRNLKAKKTAKKPETQKVKKEPVAKKEKATKKKPSANYRYMALTNQVYLFRELGNDVQTRVYQKGTTDYDSVIALIKQNTPSDSEKWAVCFEDVKPEQVFDNIPKEIDCLRYDDETKTVYIYDKALPKKLNDVVIDRLKSLVTNHQSLYNFIKRLSKNPNERVFNTLWDFMQYNNIKIDDDGFVIAWKRIRNDWKDVYSGKIDNSVGKIVEMKRENVNSDPNQTCSYGLHVCAFGYLKHYGDDTSGRIVKVKIDPADFVAIPTDYAGMKARVCKYEVIEEYKGKSNGA